MHHIRGKLGTMNVISDALYRLDRNIWTAFIVIISKMGDW